jgi:hypothetical protein
MNLPASSETPSVKAIVSLAATLASYTSHSLAPGVPAVVSKPIRYVADVPAVLQITMVLMIASVEAGVSYNVA